MQKMHNAISQNNGLRLCALSATADGYNDSATKEAICIGFTHI